MDSYIHASPETVGRMGAAMGGGAALPAALTSPPLFAWLCVQAHSCSQATSAMVAFSNGRLQSFDVKQEVPMILASFVLCVSGFVQYERCRVSRCCKRRRSAKRTT